MEYHKGVFNSGPHTGKTVIQIVSNGIEVGLYLEDGTKLDLTRVNYSWEFTETYIAKPDWAPSE